MDAGRMPWQRVWGSGVRRRALAAGVLSVLLVGLARSGEEAPVLPRAAAEAPWEREARERLGKTIAIELRETTLADACSKLAALLGLPILVQPELAKSTQKTTLPQMTLTGEHVLRWICRFNGCTYSVCDGAIVVGRDAAALPVTRSYDIHRLLFPMRDVDLPSGLAGELAEEEGNAACGVGWAAFVRATVEPETWRALKAPRGEAPTWPPYNVRYGDGHLFVTHTPAVHRQVEALLDDARRMPSQQIHILGRFLEIDGGSLEEAKAKLGFARAAQSVAERRSAPSWATLTEEQVAALMSGVLKGRKGTLLVAPRVTCFHAQRRTLRPEINYSYVPRVEAGPEPGDAGFPDEVALDVQPFLRRARDDIVLVLDWKYRAPGERLACVVTVPDGGTVLLDDVHRSKPAKGGKKGTRVVVLLTAQTVPDIFEEDDDHEEEGRAREETYDVRDLLELPRPEPRALFDLPMPTTETREERLARAGEGVARLIRATIAPGTWSGAKQAAPAEEAPREVRFRDGDLIVVHTPQVHRQVEELLQGLRQARHQQVHVFARFLDVDQAYVAELRRPAAPRRIGPQPDEPAPKREPSPVVLTQDEADALMKELVAKGKGEVAHAPRLTCFSGQCAELCVFAPRHYVHYEEPEVGGVPEGWILYVQPFAHSDRRISLVLSPEARRAPRRAPLVAELKGASAVATLPDGGSLLLAGIADSFPRGRGRPPTSLVALITAHLVPDILEE